MNDVDYKHFEAVKCLVNNLSYKTDASDSYEAVKFAKDILAGKYPKLAKLIEEDLKENAK